MNLKQLRTFTLVANLGSLSRAGKALDIAQSLVSRHLAQLESEWGDRLFERTGRGVVLTDFGRRVQPEIGSTASPSRKVSATWSSATLCWCG